MSLDSQDDGADYNIVLRWALTGEPITTWYEKGDVSAGLKVEQLEQYLDEGYLEEYGVPPATDANGDWLDWNYSLMYGTVKLQTGQHFSWYDIPSGATIHVVRDCLLYTSPSPRD